MKKSGKQITPRYEPPITSEYLDYDEVVEKFDSNDGICCKNIY